MKRLIVLAFIFFLSVAINYSQSSAEVWQKEQAYDDQDGSRQEARTPEQSGDPYMSIARELIESSDQLSNPKVAVMAFSYKNTAYPDVGLMISERLTTRIVKLRKLKIIERQMLDNVLKELHFEGTGAVDAETAKKLGKVLGVEAIITGTVLDLNDQRAEINARLIKTDTAEVLATSFAEITNSWAPRAPQSSGGSYRQNNNFFIGQPAAKPARKRSK
jgi:TolB-like protein